MSQFRRKPYKCWPGTYRGTVLTRVPPVPVLSKMPLGTGLALCGRVGGAVLCHGRARRTLVAQEELRRHGVTVLVLRRYGRLLEGPGERRCEELQGREGNGALSQQQWQNLLMKTPLSCTAPLWLQVQIFLCIFRTTRQPKASSK